MKIRAVCTDIDGTLLDSRRALSSRTIAAITSISNEVPVILASSRMPAAMRHLQQELGIEDHPMICFNGGYVISFDAKSQSPVILDSVRIPLSICETIIALANIKDVHVSIFADDEWYTPLRDQWAERETMVTKVSPTLKPFSEVFMKLSEVESGAHKVMCMGPENEMEKLYTGLSEMFNNELHIYRSKSTYLEIAPKTISKATALALVMSKIFNSDLSGVMAFGDNYNDVEMLGAVGLGIAVGNAIPEAKAVAREITGNSKEDGVADAIEKYFKL